MSTLAQEYYYTFMSAFLRTSTLLRGTAISHTLLGGGRKGKCLGGEKQVSVGRGASGMAPEAGGIFHQTSSRKM